MTACERKEKAYNYMVEGYSCSQSFALAFADMLPESEERIKLLTLGLSGGIGQLRDTCGAVSGMAVVIGALFGEGSPDKEARKALNQRIKLLARKFEEQNGSRICFDLTGLSETNTVPKLREDGRDCKDFVADFAELVAEYIEENK